MEMRKLRLGSLLGVIIWLCSFGWGIHAGCATYIATPNIEPFEVIAEANFSGQMYGASKIMYVFGPMLFAFVVAIVLVPIRTEWLDNHFGSKGIHIRSARICYAVITVWIMIFISSIHNSHALSALRISNMAQPAGNSLVEGICKIIS